MYFPVCYALTKRDLVAQRQCNSLCLASYADMPLNHARLPHPLDTEICERILSKYASGVQVG